MNTLALSCAIAVVLCAWKVVNLLWVRPKRLEKLLKRQGFYGNKYKVLFGDVKESSEMLKMEKSKPIKLSGGEGVPGRVIPFHQNLLNKYGKNFIMWLQWRPCVHTMDPELINDILMNSNDFLKVRMNPHVRYISTGLVSLNGDKWIKHRRLLNPAFHSEKLKNMLPAFELSCLRVINKWETMISSKGSCEIDVSHDIHALTSDAIARTSFGSSYEEGVQIFGLLKEQAELIVSTYQSIYLPGMRFLPTRTNKRMKAIDKAVTQSLASIIDARLKEMMVGEGKCDDLLGMMLSSNKKEVEHYGNKSHGLTIEEIIEECKIFYFAGQETLATLIVWTMVLLSEHQEWQSRAREEVLNVFGDKKVNMVGLNQLKIVTMILHEVLRLYPPVVVLARQITKDVKVRGCTLPSGSEIGLPTMLLHHDEEIWGDDAKEFKPERFSRGVSNATKNQVAYFPFGWGPRICIGQHFALLEAKITLSMILRKFSFDVSPSYVHAPQMVLSLQPQYGAHLILNKV